MVPNIIMVEAHFDADQKDKTWGHKKYIDVINKEDNFMSCDVT